MTQADWDAGRRGAWLIQPVNAPGETDDEATAAAIALASKECGAHPWTLESATDMDEIMRDEMGRLIAWLWRDHEPR